MPTVRICSVNGEWMNDWFTSDGEPVAFRARFSRDGQRNDTAQTASRLAQMITAINPHVVAIEEAPSRAAELALFVHDTSATPTGCSSATPAGSRSSGCSTGPTPSTPPSSHPTPRSPS